MNPAFAPRSLRCLLALALCALSACSAAPRALAGSGAFGASVMGHDDRRPRLDPGLRETIGSVTYYGLPVCSAALVGPTYAVTALSCLSMGPDDPQSAYRFQLGNVTDFGPLERITELRTIYENSGIVLLRLGEWHAKHLDFGTYDPSSKNLSLAAFDVETGRLLQTRTGSVVQRMKGFLYHTYDATAGASGGAFLQNGKIVAIELGPETLGLRHYNFAVEASAIEKATLWDAVNVVRPLSATLNKVTTPPASKASDAPGRL